MPARTQFIAFCRGNHGEIDPISSSRVRNAAALALALGVSHADSAALSTRTNELVGEALKPGSSMEREVNFPQIGKLWFLNCRNRSG
jgi:diketogulonate reductase-like aldo/keto reductase